MSSPRFSALAVSLLVLFVCPIAVNAAPPPGKGRPPVTFDANETPLQKAIKKANSDNLTKKRGKFSGDKKDKCERAIALGNQKQIAKDCDVADLTTEKLGEQSFKHPDGKNAGRRVVTKTTLEYDSPNQKGKADDPPQDKWPHTKIKAFHDNKEHAPSAGSARSRGASILPQSSDNDDKDCVDWVTGEHLGGVGVADGAANSCFDAAGKLVATLTELADGSGCTHRGGSAYFGNKTDGVEDDCWDAKGVLKTTVVESIDEDGPEQLDNDGDGMVNEDPPGNGNEDDDCIGGDGTIYRGATCHDGTKGHWGEELQALVDEDGPDAVDNDGDGRVNEDPPNDHTADGDDCDRLFKQAGLGHAGPGDRDADGNCDMSRALIKFVNNEATKRDDGKGKKVFNADDDGNPDSTVTDGVEPGKESRKLTLTESFGVKCKRGTTYVDGLCVPDAELDALGGPEKFTASMKLIGAVNDDGSPNMSRIAMMGFTFAPPVIEWGYRINEEVCILGFCIEIFYARIGYEFDLAVGLRLPVEIKVLDEPASVLAGKDVILRSQVEPLDFTTSQYEKFCTDQHLDRDWFIGGGGGLTACRRFGFTDFLDDMFPVISDAKKDGDEFVARYSVFAGIIVRVFGIPLLNWGIDSSLDIPAACSMMKIIQAIQDAPEQVTPDQIASLVKLLMGFADSGSTEDAAIAMVNFVKEVAGSCGSFTTPFGMEDADPPLHPQPSLRSFPFGGEYNIRADCAEALARGEVITIKGKPRPICTNMILGVSGASLGIGLGLEATLGSKTITAEYSTSEDATRGGGLEWNKSANETGSDIALTFRPDNYDGADFHDTARVALDDFTYFLDTLQLTLNATLQFGGILSPIPDIASFPIYSFTITSPVGLPIPQHPGTGAVAVNIPVENYGLKVDIQPKSQLIKPGDSGPYAINVRNIGSRAGTFDNFRVALSNRPDQTAPYSFNIDRNTDHDCVNVGTLCARGSAHFRGDPYDGVADDCYDAAGTVLSSKMECIDEDSPSNVEGLSADQRDDDGDGIPDEDPPENWATTPDPATFTTLLMSSVAPYTLSSTQSLHLSVAPFRHPLTRPGVYPFLITGDSVQAKANNMAETDPIGNFRKNAKDVAFVQVKSFYEPQVVVLPNFDGGKAGTFRDYRIEGTNGGNSDDSMTLANTFLDYNQAGCTLTTLGRLPAGTNPNCPYRAVPTVIPLGWTTAANLTPTLPRAPGVLGPLVSASDSFRITVPRDWAGMDNTTYLFRVTTVSQKDPSVPAATKSFIAKHTVTATKESMTRYIGLELDDLYATLVAAENSGLKLGGLKPVVAKPIQSKNADALASILAKDLGRASGQLSTEINLVQALVKMIDGSGKDLPATLFSDLKNRTAALIADLTAAQAPTEPSAP